MSDMDTLAERIRSEAAQATRPGQMARLEAIADAVADLIREAKAEGEIRGQMKHITAEMVRGDQPLGEKEEFIADLRARLSQVEAERDDIAARLRALADHGCGPECDDKPHPAHLSGDGLAGRLVTIRRQSPAGKWLTCTGEIVAGADRIEDER